jgi:hypothetical protein
MIDVTCQLCGAVYHSDEVHVGKHLRCTRCGCEVPILKVNRAITQPVSRAVAQPVPTSPSTQSNQPRARAVHRFRTAYVVAAAFGVVLLAGSLLVVHFQSRANPERTGTAKVSDIDEAATNQPQGPSSQSSAGEDESTRLKRIGEEPIPPEPKTTSSSTRRTRRNSAANETGIPEGFTVEPETSLENGARVSPDVGLNGYGVLNVSNGTTQDARVILYNVERDEQTRDVYVTTSSSFSITGIPVGTYELKYAIGSSFYEFERSLGYTEERTEDADRVRVNYKEISVTLHSVVGGNVRTIEISRDKFLKGHSAALSTRR